MPAAIRDQLFRRVLIADGAMGTMLQGFDLDLDDFEGYEGCNEVLNRSRPDVVAEIHRAYLAAGADCIETNTFGANLAALGEYGISEQVAELAEAGARIARRVADEFSTPHRPRFVLGSVGPGTKLPTLGHIEATTIRDGYQTQVEAMIRGGIDAVQIETSQDLQQAKAAVIGAKRACAAQGVDLPIFVSITVETTGSMLLGSETGAALATLAPLGIDVIGLNWPVGKAERRAARADRGRRRLSTTAGRAGVRLGRVRDQLRAGVGRRLLRHHTRTYPATVRGDRPRPAGQAAGTPTGQLGGVPLLRSDAQTGHQLPGDR